jgi:hypothetical protein
MVVHEEQSQIAGKNVLIIGFCMMLLITVTSYTLYNWYHGSPSIVVLGVELLGFYVVGDRAFSRYKYRFEPKTFRVEKKGLLGVHEWDVNFKDIVSVSRYTAENLLQKRYRRTFRLNATLDSRPVWVIVYYDHQKTNRLLIKPSTELVQLLKEKMPKKVHINN